jgi:hypothetical protein
MADLLKPDEERRSFAPAHDPDADHVVGWTNMPPEARAAACAAALFAGLELDTSRSPTNTTYRIQFKYDPRSRIAFAIEPSTEVANRRRGTARPVPRTVEEALRPVRAAFGTRAAEIAKFIRRR